jgi:hypothetical protein
VRLTLPFTEARELALQGGALPPIVRSASCVGATIRAEIDLRAVPGAPLAVRALAAVAPIVRVDATFRAFEQGRVTFELTIWAAAVPVHRLLNQLTGVLNGALRGRGLPDGLVVVHQGLRGEPVAVVDLQAAVALRADGVTLTDFALADGAVELEASIAGFALREL